MGGKIGAERLGTPVGSISSEWVMPVHWIAASTWNYSGRCLCICIYSDIHNALVIILPQREEPPRQHDAARQEKKKEEEEEEEECMISFLTKTNLRRNHALRCMQSVLAMQLHLVIDHQRE